MSAPAFIREALAWCNERRSAQGKPPLRRLPKGKRSDPDGCPIAKATDLVIFGTVAQRHDGKFAGGIPTSVREFVGQFDVGNLPQYEDRRRS